MSWLIDTNICIAFLKGDGDLAERLADITPSEVVLCSVVKAELLYGARRSARGAENLGRLKLFFALFPNADFDEGAAEQYGVIRAQLAASGRPVGPNDLMIAAIALQLDATVVTRNVSEFSQVPGLRVERW